ncbi:hypothetical protein F7734_43115 [Scytonema sp. UIC 10036]|uniref:hypothetical protein n=1 Tax=Scytonema sp. UIC 10036 TaxID=2304196 RepID=UPI0012DAE48D|nr:hypothetical protein [Scytonema sp. UIC 10036]MUG98724.1 hypothetical protein [Scytonema sp. UIC 10036]
MMQSDILILNVSWDELAIKYAYSVKPPVCSTNTLIVSIEIYQIGVTNAIPMGGFANAEEFESNWLNDVRKKPLLDYLQITLSLLRFEQIIDQKMLYCDRHPILKRQISNPSILHLAHLLRAEMETPKFLNQQFVSSIVTALIIHCWQQL